MDAVAAARERRGSAAVKTPGKLGAAARPRGDHGASDRRARQPAPATSAAARRKLIKGRGKGGGAGDEVQGEAGALVHEAATAGLRGSPRASRACGRTPPAVKKRDPLRARLDGGFADELRRHSRFEANMVERERSRIMNQIIHYDDDKSEAGTPTKDVKMHPWVGKSPEKKASSCRTARACCRAAA